MSSTEDAHTRLISRRQLLMSAAATTASLSLLGARARGQTRGDGMDDGWTHRSAAEQARRIRAREISSRELVELHLARIAGVNPSIRAVVALADQALAEADLADLAVAAGKPLPALHGVPMTIKDCFDTAGVVSTWGTYGRRGFVPASDATVVRRLKQAGAILLGKTNTPEFTLSFETHNKIHGFTHNPYDLARSPGGSSGGAAALIAAGGTPFDIGTDYGGSIRVPSHFCGTVGIKPTQGSVPRTGLCLPPGLLTDALSHVGPMARRVEDLMLLLPIIWGPDGVDTRIQPVPYPDPARVVLKGLKCVVMADNGVAKPDDATMAAVVNAGRILADAGLNVVEGRIPGADQIVAIDTGFWSVGVHAAIKQLLTAAGTKPDDYANNWFRATDGALDGTIRADQLNLQLARFEAQRSRLQQYMSDYDVLVSPVNARPAPLHPAPGEASFPIEYASYTMVFDHTGWPSGVVRGSTSSTGLPIGVQVTANPWRDDIVLAVMAHLERSLPAFDPPLL
jgi:amidase